MLSQCKWFLMCCSFTVLGIAPLMAQEKKIPEAKQILAKHLKAIGGEDNVAKIRSLQTEAKMTIRGIGVGGTVKSKSGSGGQFLQEVELAGIGREVIGSDGKTAWSTSAITGAKLLDGTLAEQMKLRSLPISIAEYPKFFDSIECNGTEKFDGVECYVVKSIKANWKPVFDYFDTVTGLHRGTKEKIATDQGEFESITTVSDYRDVDGVKFPFLSVTTIGPQVMETQTTIVKLNPTLETSAFDLPDEVKALKK